MISVILPAGESVQDLDRSFRALVPDLSNVEVLVAGGGDAVAEWAADRPGLTHVQPGITDNPVADAVRDCAGDTLLFLEPGTVLSKGWVDALTKAAKGKSFGFATFGGKKPSSCAYAVSKAAYSDMGSGLPKGSRVSELPALAKNNKIESSALNVRAVGVGEGTGGSAKATTTVLMLQSNEPGILDLHLSPDLAAKAKRGLASTVMHCVGSGTSVKSVDASDRPIGVLVREAVDAGADKVVVVDPLVPGINQDVLRDAGEALDEADIVVGPTDCGHIYLLAVDCAKAAALDHLETGLPVSENTVDVFAQSANLDIAKLVELRSCNNLDDFRHLYCSGHINF